FFFSSRRRHTRFSRDWSSDVCSSDLICHSKTRNLAEHVRRADIVVAAVGVAELVRGEWLKPGATVIDVGMNKKDNKLCGDVHFRSEERRVGKECRFQSSTQHKKRRRK